MRLKVTFKLTSRYGKEKGTIIFDNEDIMLLFNYRWSLSRRTKRCLYVSASIDNSNRRIYMHQLILPVPKRFVVDHINGNGLDNRRCNLRQATIAQNLRNTPPMNGRKYKGTYYAKRGKNPLRKPWAARLNLATGNKHLGYFETEIEAAIAYNQAAKKHFGDRAWLNPINK
jgi:hypothetical protein